MALKFFRPKSGRFNTMIAFVTADLPTTIANSTTTTINAGGVHRRAFVERLALSARTIVASAGAVTGVISKYRAADDTVVPLTAAFDLKSLVTGETSAVPFLTTLSDLDRTLAEGDTIQLVVTAAGTITTQPVDFRLATELAVLE